MYSKFFTLFFFLINCRASLPKHLNENIVISNSNGFNLPIVFVPGIKGSKLIDDKGNLRWLDAATALGFSTPDLRLSGESRELKPKGALDRITAVPYLIDVAVYAPWLKAMSEQDDIDFYVFSYDWRKKNLDSRDQLIEFLEEIGKKYQRKPILIGHSMGGMLSLSAINLKPSLVQKVVFVGVPFRGGIGYMKDLHVGVGTGLNSKIQSPCMIARYETVYGFFPRLNTWDSKDVVVDSQGKTLELDLYDGKVWKENHLGFYAQKCEPADIPSDEEFQINLNNSWKFRESLTPSKDLLKSKLPMLVIHGNNLLVRKAMTKLERQPNLNSNEKNFYWDLEIAPKEMGDGSVSYANSLPPEPLVYQSILTTYEHSALLNDPKVIKSILGFIR
ncbi:MAG: alpha/beta fold hydrolase [Leptospira sp.]|nr:alpha/beta fold hydrolase [Leptospira sp.]